MLQRARDELAANALIPERSADIHASNEPLVCELERFFAPKTDRADEFCLANAPNIARPDSGAKRLAMTVIGVSNSSP
jgi:hypothetical protein